MLIKRNIQILTDGVDALEYRLNGERVWIGRRSKNMHIESGADDMDDNVPLREFALKLALEPHGNIQVTDPSIIDFLKRTGCLL